MKGISYTLEAAVAALIIAMAALSVLNVQFASSLDSAKQDAYHALSYLSLQQDFRRELFEKDTQALDAMLRTALSNFQFEVCDPACAGIAPLSGRETIIAEWHIAGYRDSASPKTLRVYMFR